MNILRVIVGLLILFSPFRAVRADDTTGLKTFVAVDIVGEAFRRDKQAKVQEALIRGAEVYFSAPIDSYFDGALGLAAHPEKGVSVFELHEAIISSSRLIPLTNIRVGQGFLAIGRLNSTHQHDWPFISAPKVHATFFDDEGINDILVESTINLPVNSPVALTLGLAKGWTFGHAHSEGERPKVPTHYARLQFFRGLPANGGVQLGLNLLRRTDARGDNTTLIGLDKTAKWREGRILPFFVQSEVWYRQTKGDASSDERSLGFYMFPQMNVAGAFDLGLRLDSLSVLNLKDIAGMPISNGFSAIVPTLTIKPSEFSTLRVAYELDAEKQPDRTQKISNAKLDLQVTFIMGAHPAHEF